MQLSFNIDINSNACYGSILGDGKFPEIQRIIPVFKTLFEAIKPCWKSQDSRECGH